MNKKLVLITALLTIFSFSSLVYAQEAYSFSGFGGGLPSSATIVETASVTPDELSATTAGSTNTVLITTLVVGGVIVVGSLVMIATLSTEGGKEFMAECAGEAAEECMVQSIDTCVEETCSGEIFKFIMPIYIP